MRRAELAHLKVGDVFGLVVVRSRRAGLWGQLLVRE
jgi:hypothetical protein